MAMFKKFNTNKDRGVAAEKAVQRYLDGWVERNFNAREYNRLTDTKAAGRIVKAAPADFEFFYKGVAADHHGLIEVKQTEHDYRLARDKLPQLPRLRRRWRVGGISLVLVLHSTIEKWRVMDVPWLIRPNDKGSWDLSDLPLFDSCAEALEHYSIEAFK